PVSELTLRSNPESATKNPDTETTRASTPAEETRVLAPEKWVQVGKTWNFPHDGGATIKYGKTQIAVFNFASRGEWYATQNMCPHRREFVLSRGMIGDTGGKPKVACPVHKKTFSLETGQCTSTGDHAYSVHVFPVKV